MQQHEGLRRMQTEMDRQCADALATLAAVREAASAAAASARRTGAVVLAAMGGSHHVNVVAAPLYRELGLDCRACIASELLSAPLPDFPHTMLIASQSGRSGEIVELVGKPAGRGERYALTLDGDSALAQACEAALVAHGGPEQAFAATRSITLTLAMHGAILEALGASQAALRAVFEAGERPSIEAAEQVLSECEAILFAGYGPMAGAASSAALAMMELARVVTVGFEGGQFRHGPFEVLRPGLGVVLLRSAGGDGPLVRTLARATLDAGCATVVADASGEAQIPDATTVSVPENKGLAAATSILLALQPLSIAMARRRVSGDVGTPLRTSKVTV
ncbi:SIS domain-containing protein [Labrys okinawensis]|uniref:SIS domain-containing protein n=1 Tax=Labrys okinawensis TaxID=346911 RepID=UPI0039BC4ED9